MKVIGLVMAFVFNLLLILMEGAIFFRVKNKLNILKFYTFLQNFIALTVSILFCVFDVRELLGYGNIPELIEYSGGVEHPDRLMLNTLTGEIEQAFRRN